MIRLVRWLLILALLGGLAVVFVAVPFQGQTLLDRLLGEPTEGGPVPADGGTRTAGQVADPDRADPGSDRLTDDDRKDLDDLIEEKLNKEEGGKEP